MTEEINTQRRVGRPPGKKESEEAGSVQVERPKKHEPKEATVLGKNPVSAVTGQSRTLIFVGIALCACILLLAAVIVLKDADFPQTGGSFGNRIYPLANESGEPDLQATVDALQGQIEAGMYSAIPQPREAAPVVVEEICFPEVGRIAPKPLKNGEWLYDCLSAGEGNWLMPSDEWRLANWKKGKDAYEIVNIVIPEGAATLGLGCIPCTVLTPSGETVSPTDTDFGPFDPNISLPVIPGEVYKVRTFGAEECSVTSGPCPPSISIWFNVNGSQKAALSDEHTCLQAPAKFVSLGRFWEANVFVDAKKGETKIFSHCPPGTSIRYELLAVDDEIDRVEVVCSFGVTDITELFSRTETTELLPHYQSLPIDLEGNCRVDFIVKDIHGGRIGMIIKKSHNGASGVVRFISKGSIPDGSTYTAQVNPGELHLFTAGPVCVLGTCLNGGETRASVIAMQSLDSSYSVELSGLVAFSNWYGAYKADPESWNGLISATVDGMKKPGNCSNGKACETIDVIIIDAGAIVKREVR